LMGSGSRMSPEAPSAVMTEPYLDHPFWATFSLNRIQKGTIDSKVSKLDTLR
jgi:hypothetical protein